MGRKIKETADYFPHFAECKQVDTLQKRFGNNAYVLFYKLKEYLCLEPKHYLDFSKKGKWRDFLDNCLIEEPEAETLLLAFAEREVIDEELWTEKRIVWSDILITELSALYSNRGRELPKKPCFDDFSTENKVSEEVFLQQKCTSSGISTVEMQDNSPKNEFLQQKSTLNDISTTETPQRKEKKSKEKKSKEEESNTDNSDKEIKEQSQKPLPPPPKSPHGEFGNVFLSESEHKALIDRYGTTATENYIGQLDRYMQKDFAIKARYARRNHYAVLIDWIEKDRAKKTVTTKADIDKPFVPTSELPNDDWKDFISTADLIKMGYKF